MAPLDALTLSPTAADVLAHIVVFDRYNAGVRSMSRNAEIARAVGRPPQSTHSALKALASLGLITDPRRGPVQLHRDAPLLRSLEDLLFVAMGEPLPRDIAESPWVHPVELTVDDVHLPYVDAADDDAKAAQCGPSLEAARRVILDEWRMLLTGRSATDAVAKIYGPKSEFGDARDLLNDLRRASDWLHQATDQAARGGRDRISGQAWATHDVLIDRTLQAVDTFSPVTRPLSSLQTQLRDMVDSQPSEPEFLAWMRRNLGRHLA